MGPVGVLLAFAMASTPADDALVERLLLETAVEWPEQVGSGEALTVRRHIEWLDRVITEHPLGDRVVEARYRRALLRMEPVPGHDLAGAHDDLLAVANSQQEPWVPRARHALAWNQEQAGRVARALEAYQRVIVDYPGDAAAAHSMAGLGRLLLRDGEPGQAAAILEQAIGRGAGPDTGAVATREAAVRRLLQPPTPQGSPRSVTVPLEDVTAIAPGSEGLCLASRRAGEVVRLAPDGRVSEAWHWDVPVDALAADLRGRPFAAAGGSVWRLEPGGRSVELAMLGEFHPPGALAIGAGAVWVVDRRGQRLGRIEPGQPGPVLVAEDREARIVALAWDGQRLLGLDGRTGAVRALWVAGGRRGLVAAPAEGIRPELLGVDPSGRLLLVDPRAGAMRLLDRGGELLVDLRAAALGVERVAAAALGPDGGLHLVDGRGARWVSWP